MKTFAVIALAAIVLTVMVWDTIEPLYYKYRASKEKYRALKEPSKYSICEICKEWNSHKHMWRERVCDDCTRYEWWIRTETGAEFLEVYNEGE